MGITNARLAVSPLQWPCPTPEHPGTERRYTDHRFSTPDGRAHFVACTHQLPQEIASLAFPLTLTTGRLPSQWHTMTRTGKIPKLANQAVTPFVEVHTEDAKTHAITEGDMVIVRSPRGQVTVKAKLTERITRGVVFMPFHWGDLFANGIAANNLTNDVFDPISKEPEYKACAVAIARVS